MAVTVKDIAKHTGLGLATISKFLNGGNVREENRIAIEKAIEELDFTVNAFARGLKTSQSKTIGVIIPEFSNLFITSIITVIEDALRQDGYGLIVCDCRTNEQMECDAVHFLLNKMVDGIINMPVCQDGHHLQAAIDKKIPIVLIDRMIPQLDNQVDAVLVDNIDASYMAVEYLIQNNHKNIGIILGSRDIFTSQERLTGYQQALTHYAIPFNESFVFYGDYTIESGYSNTKKLMQQKELTALFITNYEMTLGSIIAMNEDGVKIPETLSIIGFDNMQLSKIIKPQLTIVSQPLKAIGKQVANILLQKLMSKEKSSYQQNILQAKLHFGQSVQKL